VKYAWMQTHSGLFSVSRMSRVLDVSRTGYCQWRVRAPSERSIANATVDAQVAAIHAATKRSYVRPRIVRDLHASGIRVGHERVRKSLKRQALSPV
jgi:putative transposase